MRLQPVPYDEFMTVRVTKTDADSAIAINGSLTSGVGIGPSFPNKVGAVGVFLKKGTLRIRKIEILELP